MTLRREKRFVTDVVVPWLSAHPQRLPAALALSDRFHATATLRAEMSEVHGVPIPSTLMIAINSYCNLRCPTCTVGETVPLPDHSLSRAQLDSLFDQCRTLGISNFVILGGEPLLWTSAPDDGGIEDVIAAHPEAFVSLFTNGRRLDDERAARLAALDNLAMFINAGSTNRRGPVASLDRGVTRAMEIAERHGLLFGFSTTISEDSVGLFSRRETLDHMADLGARFGLFMDYLPEIGIAQNGFSTPAAARAGMVACAEQFAEERDFFVRLVPEDEALFGGCMAAGRVILFISAYGTIDPCPFVPFSNAHVDQVSLLDVLRSRFMGDVRERSRDWEMRGGACAVRAAAGEFNEVVATNDVHPNVAWRRDAEAEPRLKVRLRRAPPS